MAYVETVWRCGDEITADRMNNLEEGVQQALGCCGGGEPLIVRVDWSNGTLNKTFGEIKQALFGGRPIYAAWQPEGDGLIYMYFSSIYLNGLPTPTSGGQVAIYSGEPSFIAESDSDYPSR